MFKIAVLIGIYSYTIFFLGLLGFLNKMEMGVVTALFVCGLVWTIKEKLQWSLLRKRLLQLSRFEKGMLILLVIQIFINLIGVLAPELAFDSLWYHLTLPKIYLADGAIKYISGSLFYYSAMPKLVDMLFIPSLLFGGETLAKFVHFLFGIATLVVIYKLARKFVNTKLSFLACIIFYSNLVVAWISTTAYVDLGRAFFEVLSFLLLVNYLQTKKNKYLTQSAVSLGFAIATKLLAIFSLVVFVPIVLVKSKSIFETIKFAFVCLLIPAPWFIFSYLATNNPVYPFLSNMYKTPFELNIANLLGFIHSPDPVSPIYLIFLPIAFLVYKKLSSLEKVLMFYVIASFVLWFVIQTAGTGRYLISYLPMFSVLCVCILAKVRDARLVKALIFFVIFISLVTIGYRGAASIKYMKVIAGFESKDHFLSNNLNFAYGDFYDTDHYFAKYIKFNDRVLIYNIHNLYYVDFPYIESSQLGKGDFYNYVLVRGKLPNKFSRWRKVYENVKTNVKLYKKT